MKQMMLTATLTNGRLYQEPLNRTRRGILGPCTGERVKLAGTLAINRENVENGAIWFFDGCQSHLVYEYIHGMGWRSADECPPMAETRYYDEIKDEHNQLMKQIKLKKVKK